MSDRGQAEIFVPAVAEFPQQLKVKYNLLEKARNQGFNTGIMLVLLPGGLTPEKAKLQLDNLEPYLRLPSSERPSIFAMHPNLPLTGDKRLNFLDNPNWSQEYLEQSIDLVAQLPSEFTPATGKALSFHLNTLIKPKQWVSDEDYWAKAFEGVLSKVKAVAEFGQRHGVKVAIETLPLTEYGDVAKEEKRLMDDGHTFWADLGNPWPLLFWRDEISKLRQAGSKIAIDVCHSFIAIRTVEEVRRLSREGKGKEALSVYMIHPSDLEKSQTAGSYDQQVLTNTAPGDIWHVSDAKGLYKTPELHGEQTHFEEGVALFEGDIPVDTLEKIIKEGLQKDIKFVIETMEADYSAPTAPVTERSLNSVLKQSKK